MTFININIKMVTDKSLLEWYKRGFKDELTGSSSLCSEHELENKAYGIGAKHSSGKWDNTKIIDYLSDEEILVLIKRQNLQIDKAKDIEYNGYYIKIIESTMRTGETPTFQGFVCSKSDILINEGDLLCSFHNMGTKEKVIEKCKNYIDR